MDLALELGLPVGLLKRVMSEREFGTWLAYDRTRKLPQQRLELYMAQLTQAVSTVIAAFGGGKVRPLSEFVIDFDSSNNAEPEEEDVAALFDFKPRAKKHGT